jgi:hypothetical protein
VKGAVPVATVEVITPVAETVVNAPVEAVVAPTVPLILIDAVPVRFVTVPELGVPKAPPLTTNAPEEPTLTPKAVATPVPKLVIPVPPLATGRVPETSAVRLTAPKVGAPEALPCKTVVDVPALVVANAVVDDA